MTDPSPVDGLERALGATGDLIAAVRADQWSQPTPCPGWSVRTLINHLVTGHRMFAAMLSGEMTAPPERRASAPDVDVLGEDPVDAYRESAEQLLTGFHRPGAREQVFWSPFGRVPGAVLAELRTTEALVHGWDIAQAIGAPTGDLPQDLAEHALDFARERIPQVTPGRGPFGPPQPVADDAPAIDQLAALLGRTLS